MNIRFGVSMSLAFLGMALPGHAAAAGSAGTSSGHLSVTVDRGTVATALGNSFSFRTTITNNGDEPATGAIVHLNVVSLTAGVYVDPEDWSSQRTRYLGPIAAHATATTTWSAKAVNAGTFAVYVAVLSRPAANRPPLVGPAIQVDVAGRTTLDPGGIVFLAVGVPALLALLTVAQRFRR